ncbi:hypothetical protein IRJ41_022463, partial [Triplophysa rosa]
ASAGILAGIFSLFIKRQVTRSSKYSFIFSQGLRNPITKPISMERTPSRPLPAAACEKHSIGIGLRKAAKTPMNKPQHLLRGLHVEGMGQLRP